MRILFIFLTIFLLTSCRYDEEFSEVKELRNLKVQVEEIVDEELTMENQQIITNYFGRIKNVLYEVRSNQSIQKYTHRNFSKFYKNNFCNDFIIETENYSKLMNKCSVSGFYICSEEARSYVDLLKSAKSLLATNNIDMILKDESCKKTLKNLGVINE